MGYWGIRARGQYCRHLLAYTGLPWKEKTYTSPPSWFEKDKKNLGMLFPNLPYIVDGNYKISESLAIMKYIANKSGKKELIGKDLKDQAMVDNLIGIFNDVLSAIAELFFSETFADSLPLTVEKIKPKIELVNKFYGEKEFALGYITIVDFLFAELSYYIREVSKELYEKCPSWDRV